MATKATRVPRPDFESTGNRARNVAAGGPGVSGFQNTSAADIGAGAAVALEALQKLNIERDSVASVKAEGAAVTSAETAMAALDPMAPDYMDRVKEIWGNAGKSAMDNSGISTSVVKDDLERRMTRHATSAELIAGRVKKDAVSKEATLTAWDSVNSTSAKIRNDPANANAYIAEFQSDMERLKVGMDPATLGAFSRKAADDLAKNQVIGFAERGNYGAARAAMKEQAPHLDTGVVTGLSNYIDAKESKARADGERARTQNVAGFLVDVDDQFSGNKPIDPNNRQRLDDLKARGAISPEGYLTAVRTLNNEEAKYKVEQGKNLKAAEELSTGTLSSQENADRAFNNALGPLPIGRIAMQGSAEDRANTIKLLTGMASTSGYLPTQMKNMLGNADTITDPNKAQVVAFAAEAADEIETRVPGKIAGVSLNETGNVNMVRSEAKRLMQEGVPKAQAYVQAAQSTMGKDKTTLQAEQDSLAVANEVLKKTDIGKEASLAVAGITTFAERNIPLVTMPDVRAQMGQVWERTFRDAMVKTGGDETRATALAQKVISETYGVTRVGTIGDQKVEETVPGAIPETTGTPGQGKPSVVPYPAERYFGPLGRAILSEEQRARVVETELDAIQNKYGIGPKPDKDVSGLPTRRLFPDARTAEDIRSGRPPSYQVQFLRGHIYEPVPTTNGALRYVVPNDEQLKTNQVFLDANNARVQRDLLEKEKNIQLQQVPPDLAADERAKRMREEGKRTRGNR